MKVNRKFGVLWEDLVDINKEPLQGVRVVIYMPLAIANMERGTIEGIKMLVERWIDDNPRLFS